MPLATVRATLHHMKYVRPCQNADLIPRIPLVLHHSVPAYSTPSSKQFWDGHIYLTWRGEVWRGVGWGAVAWRSIPPLTVIAQNAQEESI
jgi:hypothetical protein